MSLSSHTVQSADATSRPQSSGSEAATLSLLYHELRSQQSDYGYALSTELFEEHLHLFSRLTSDSGTPLLPRVTFDDGHRSNFEQALPRLLSYRVTARFFITAGWTSTRPEYMSWEQLRELLACGQQIGAHGWSHKLLTHCSDAELDVELIKTRQVLEDKLGTGIRTLSLPGGRWDRRVLEACRRAGYTQVFTSVPQVQKHPHAALVGRLNLRAGTSADWLQTLLAPGSNVLRKLERQQNLKEAVQRTLGDRLYMKLWTLLNRAESGDHPR